MPDPKLQLTNFIAGRLELDRLRAGRLRRKRARELKRSPDSPGPSPEQVENAVLREAIGYAIATLNLIRP